MIESNLPSHFKFVSSSFFFEALFICLDYEKVFLRVEVLSFLVKLYIKKEFLG
jgi:hypothetical protein